MDLSGRSKAEKVKKIFERLDKNKDGGLNRDERAALLPTGYLVTGSARTNEDFVDFMFEEYAVFFNGEKGLTYEGLLQFYNDGMRNLDGDFRLLGLELDPAYSTAAVPKAFQNRRDKFYRCSRRKYVEEVEISIAELKAKQRKDGNFKEYDLDDIVQHKEWSGALKGWELEPSSSSAVSTGKIFICKESGRYYREFQERLRVVEQKLHDWPMEEAFHGHMEIGRVLYEHHLLKDALDAFKLACELRPTYVTPHFRAGNCLYVLGRYGAAGEEFSLALDAAQFGGDCNWDFLAQIHINLGSSREGTGMVSTAYDHYKEAVILCPTNFRAWKLLGSALLRFGEYSAAEKALVRAIYCNPDYADAHFVLGLVLIAMGQRERGIQELQKAMELKPGHIDAMYNLGTLSMDVGDHPKALEMYTQVLAIQPNNWRSQFNRAVVLSWAGDGKKAKKAIREACKMSKNVESHAEMIAHIKQLQEKMAKAGPGAVDEQIKADLDKVHQSHIKFVNIGRGLIRTQAFKIDLEELAQLFV